MRGSEHRPDFSAVAGRRLLIALSGGADSVALAVMLSEAREDLELTLFAAHVDHGIRPDSAADADFCRELCRKLGIPFFCARVDAPEAARRTRTGLETVARRLRHDQLRRFMAETGAELIALAHHMDDQAETVLMHLGRGAGPDGVCGMRTLSGPLYRPLLDWRKAELVEYLRARVCGWREDSTNRLDDNPRNAIRLHVMPELEKCYPQFVSAVARFARSAQIEGDCLSQLTEAFLAKGGAREPFCRWIDLTDPPHPAILRRALRARCPIATDWEQVNALEALCAQARGKLDLGGGVFAERTGRRLYFVPKRLAPIAPVPLAMPGETRLLPVGRIVATPCAPVPVWDDPNRQVLNAAALKGAVLRTRRAGDRIRPLGGGDKLLSDYFTDRKVDRPLRDAVALVAVGNRVHWACGLGISQEAALVPGCEGLALRFDANTQYHITEE